MDNQKCTQLKLFGLVHGNKIIIHITLFFYTANNYFGNIW